MVKKTIQPMSWKVVLDDVKPWFASQRLRPVQRTLNVWLAAVKEQLLARMENNLHLQRCPEEPQDRGSAEDALYKLKG